MTAPDSGEFISCAGFASLVSAAWCLAPAEAHGNHFHLAVSGTRVARSFVVLVFHMHDKAVACALLCTHAFHLRLRILRLRIPQSRFAIHPLAIARRVLVLALIQALR
jgi:hypothetical protein